MNEQFIRRNLENLDWDAEDIEDAIAAWADAENDRQAEEEYLRLRDEQANNVRSTK